MVPLIGIIDQLYDDSKIVVISIDEGKKRLTIPYNRFIGTFKCGDFVIEKNNQWKVAENSEELKKVLYDKIEKLYQINVKK